MTTNFTFRDFLVYLMTGLIVLILLGMLYLQLIIDEFVFVSKTYTFIKDYSVLVTIFLVPFIYIAGHMINTVDFIILKYYVWLHSSIKKIRWLKWFLVLNRFLFYQHRIAFQIVKHWKSASSAKAFDTTEQFWVLCAKLQKEKLYDNAGYWYLLNDLFKAIYLAFFTACILAITEHKWTVFLICFILLILSKIRASQFASFFVDTIVRLSRTL